MCSLEFGLLFRRTAGGMRFQKGFSNSSSLVFFQGPKTFSKLLNYFLFANQGSVHGTFSPTLDDWNSFQHILKGIAQFPFFLNFSEFFLNFLHAACKGKGCPQFFGRFPWIAEDKGGFHLLFDCFTPFPVCFRKFFIFSIFWMKIVEGVHQFIL